jgi:hypothetical protein
VTYSEFVRAQSGALLSTGAVATPIAAVVTARQFPLERVLIGGAVLAGMMAALAWPLLAREGAGERLALRPMDEARDRAVGIAEPVDVAILPRGWSPHVLALLAFGGSLLLAVLDPRHLGPAATAAMSFGLLAAGAQRRAIRAVEAREAREGTLYLLVGLQGLIRPVLRIVRLRSPDDRRSSLP